MPEGASPERSGRSAAPTGAVLTGIACAIASFAVFALHDAAIKWVVMADYSPWQVLFSRSLVILAICLAIGRKRVVIQTLRSPIRNALLARSIGLLLAWLCFYTAAGKLQLAELMTIYFASPLLVAVLAVPLLRETVTRLRWISILIGFGGVLIACRPGDLSHAGAIGLALLAAVLWAGSMILIRQIATKEPTLVQMLTSCFSFVLMTGAVMPFKWVTPGFMDLTFMIGIGVLGSLAQYLLIEGIRRAPASVVSPLEFTALVWSFVLGYWIWSDMPGLNVFAGAVLILVSGAFIVLEEWRRARAMPAEAPAE
ncbi:DMT family transporter [Dongia sp.]|uniref:DMT family transporter n=1 Tax=Dongia sp. TaxID=1977262 RepID=UPI0037509499